VTEEKKTMQGIDIGASIMAGVRVEAKPEKPTLVIGPDGQVIGQLAKPEPEVTLQDAADVMTAALRNETERKMIAIGAQLNEVAKVAWRKREEVPVADYRLFSTRLIANKALAELEVIYQKQNREIDAALALIPSAPEYEGFRKAVAEQRRAIKDAWDLK